MQPQWPLERRPCSRQVGLSLGFEPALRTAGALLVALVCGWQLALAQQPGEGAGEPADAAESTAQQAPESLEGPAPLYSPGGRYLLFGVGLGEHRFFQRDTQRRALTEFGSPRVDVIRGGDNAIEEVALRQIWVEYYFGPFGIGVRLLRAQRKNARIMAAKFREPGIVTSPLGFPIIDDYAFTSVQDVKFQATLLTSQFVFPISLKRSLFVGALIGFGPSDYSSEIRSGKVPGPGTFLPVNVATPQVYSAEGMALLGSVFLEFGSAGFGARFGVNGLNAELGDFTGPGVTPGAANADASGWAPYLDLRFGW